MTKPRTTTSLAEMFGAIVIGFEEARRATRQELTGDAFYQRRLPTRGVPPWTRTVEIKVASGRTADELCPVDLTYAAWAAQLGTVVSHPWPVRRSHLSQPDEPRTGLDPQPGTIAGAYSLWGNPRAIGSAPVWAEFAQVEPDDFELASVHERIAKIGDPHAAIDRVAHHLTPPLEWSERGERDGQGDMPYPPENPKMPGEPKRVQSGKDRGRQRYGAR